MLFTKYFALPFLISAVVFSLAVVGYDAWQATASKRLPFIAEPTTFTYMPPSQANPALVTPTKGSIIHKDRSGRTGEKIEPFTALQGETVSVDATSSAFIDIPGIATLHLKNQAAITFLSLLSNELTLLQSEGVITITGVESVPLAVKTLHAVINLASGSATLSVDSLKSAVTVNTTGEATFAYQDDNHNTYVEKLPTDSDLVYNDSNRTIVIRR